MEAFFSTVKKRGRRTLGLSRHAKGELFDYIEVFYNQGRRRSSAGRMSPAAFDRRTSQAA
jgi:putative transposase